MLKKLAKKMKERGGFTLAELVVTTAVMGTLAAVAVPRFSNVNEIAKERKTLSVIDNILSASQNYYNETTVTLGRGQFPGQTSFRDNVSRTKVFENQIFLSLFGGSTVSSPYEEGDYFFTVTGGSGTGQQAVSPTITVDDDEDAATLVKSLTP